jgi:hypothetical protein
MDLRLVFTIPSGKLTINGLVLGLKEAAPEVLGSNLPKLLEAECVQSRGEVFFLLIIPLNG